MQAAEAAAPAGADTAADYDDAGSSKKQQQVAIAIADGKSNATSATTAAGGGVLSPGEAAIVDDAVRKVSRVMLPLLFLAAICAYIDKGNFAFAALQLNVDLGLNSADFGLASGIFFAGFGAAILPSTFVTMRYGARWWFGFLSVAWGAVSAAQAGVRTKGQLLALRLLLGITEAGAVSSAGHLMALFFPPARRSFAFTTVLVAQVVSGIFAPPLAAALLQLDGRAGLRGWQWLFLLEGLPSILLGFCIMWLLPSFPTSAWMLTPQERELLHLAVHGAAKAEAARTPPRWNQLWALVVDAVKRGRLWFLILANFLWALTYFSLISFLPVLVNNLLSGTALAGSTSSGLAAAPPPGKHSGSGSGSGGPHGGGAGALQQSTTAILLTMVPSATATFAMLLTAWHADRPSRPGKFRGPSWATWHIALPWLCGGVVLACFSPATKSGGFAAGFVILVLAATLANAPTGVMVARVVNCLDSAHAGVGLALFTAVSAVLAGFAGPAVVGGIVQRLGSFGLAAIAMGAFSIVAGLLMAGLALSESRRLRRRLRHLAGSLGRQQKQATGAQQQQVSDGEGKPLAAGAAAVAAVAAAAVAEP